MKVVIVVANPREAALAQRLAKELGADTHTTLLLEKDFPVARAEQPQWSVTHDAERIMWVAHTFDALLSFEREFTPEAPASFCLIQCFKEVGVPTLEVQGSLFRPRPPVASPAERFLSWTDGTGVGYPSPLEQNTSEPYFLQHFILIAPGDDWTDCTEEGRHVFGIAIAKLVQQNPGTQFVYGGSNDESSAFDDLVEMLSGYLFDNLHVETEHPLEQLLLTCDGVIGTLSTVLADAQLAGKPTVAFLPVSQNGTKLPPEFRLRTFSKAPELLEQWQEFIANPDSFRPQVGVAPLDQTSLTEVISSARAERRPEQSTKSVLEQIALRRSLISFPNQQDPEYFELGSKLDRIEHELHLLSATNSGQRKGATRAEVPLTPAGETVSTPSEQTPAGSPKADESTTDSSSPPLPRLQPPLSTLETASKLIALLRSSFLTK